MAEVAREADHGHSAAPALPLDFVAIRQDTLEVRWYVCHRFVLNLMVSGRREGRPELA